MSIRQLICIFLGMLAICNYPVLHADQAAQNYLHQDIEKINSYAHPVTKLEKIKNLPNYNSQNFRTYKKQKIFLKNYNNLTDYYPPFSKVYGINIGLPLAYHTNKNKLIVGIDFSFLFTDSNTKGLQLSPVNVGNNSDGAQIGAMSIANNSNVLQFSAFNYSKNSYNAQIGIVNCSEKSHGIQIGLINIIDNALMPVFPIFNFSF
jgi:hypothetical protein